MSETHIYTIHDKSEIIHSLDIIDHKMVLLGEATHGTKEFYEYRFEIVKHVIDHGFFWIFFEADWEHIYELNRFIHNKGNFKTCIDSMHRIKKFPLWMIRNSVICDMLKWMKDYNRKHNYNELYDGIVFMGVDCYDDKYSTKLLFENGISTTDILELEELYVIHKKQLVQSDEITADRWKLLRKTQCLKVLIGNYYYYTNPTNKDTWTIRDSHWLDMIQNVESFAGDTFKGVLWAHNSHVGDSINNDKINIGRLIRQYYLPENVLLIGFITYSGTVRAADKWGSKSKVVYLNIPDKDTYSYMFHELADIYGKEFSIIFGRDVVFPTIYQRAIGVIYKKDSHRISHYSKSDIQQRFDMVYYIDHTTAIDKI